MVWVLFRFLKEGHLPETALKECFLGEVESKLDLRESRGGRQVCWGQGRTVLEPLFGFRVRNDRR